MNVTLKGKHFQLSKQTVFYQIDNENESFNLWLNEIRNFPFYSKNSLIISILKTKKEL